jgi:hypothetical protein
MECIFWAPGFAVGSLCFFWWRNGFAFPLASTRRLAPVFRYPFQQRAAQCARIRSHASAVALRILLAPFGPALQSPFGRHGLSGCNETAEVYRVAVLFLNSAPGATERVLKHSTRQPSRKAIGWSGTGSRSESAAKNRRQSRGAQKSSIYFPVVYFKNHKKVRI